MSDVDVAGDAEPVATLAGALRVLLGTSPSWVSAPSAAHHMLESLRQLVQSTGLVCSVVNTAPPRPHVSAAWSAARSAPSGLLGMLASNVPEWTPLLNSTSVSNEVRHSASSLVWRRELDIGGAEVVVHASALAPNGDVIVLSGLYPWHGRLQAERQIACLPDIVELIAFAGLTTPGGRPFGLVDLESERHGADRSMLVDALEHIDEAVVYAPAGALPMLGNRSARLRFADRPTPLTMGDILTGPLVGAPATARALVSHRVAAAGDAAQGLPRVTALRSDDSALTGIVVVLAAAVTHLTPATAAHDDGSSTEAPVGFPLTRREREVAELLMLGYRTAFIAEQLFVGQDTVRSHIKSMFAKLGVHSQAELVRTLREGPSTG